MRKIPYLHIILFIVTFLTTLTAGALQKGVNIFREPGRIIEGLPFAGTLMTILLCHELSHYIASKKHHTKATLPYFIPAPSIIGTFGAFIKMKSPIITRKALIDIGASGPIAGFIVSVIACIVGLSMSEIAPLSNTEGALSLGDSILFSFLSNVILGVAPDNHDIFLHPVAFAGWIGLFVTSLNLIPVGQLDGGHIAFAILGERHKYLSRALVIVLAILGILYWEGWALWAVLMLILGIKHPPVLYWEVPLDSKRRSIGIFTFIIFVITFIPSPFKFLP
ncbi:metalloprotease [Dissulfurispira thermophila]|uniref:Metalloprotease n=1 Tax=Dissulfurispira thermophila TaxID=2715679 RepID=A0A7G1H4P8_9BACT|nr:site-2 protease family protein [Dissulfurispira thermophila]BCB96727.1 metalloprotease [Dissulfurispira thermophila]